MVYGSARALTIAAAAAVLVAVEGYRRRRSRARRSAPILCFGDSITAGYVGVWGPKNPNEREVENVSFHPYALRLGELLVGKAATVTDCLRKAQALGYSGYTAQELLPELRRALRAGPWRAVVVCAGTNDVSRENVDEDEIYRRILALVSLCERWGVPVVVLPPLDCDLAWVKYVNPHVTREPKECERVLRRVAERILEHCRARGLPVVDTRRALPYDVEAHGAMWDDTVHLSTAGSDKLGALVYDAVVRAGL